jgi:probable HAF family extracellular repeat protein
VLSITTLSSCQSEPPATSSEHTRAVSGAYYYKITDLGTLGGPDSKAFGIGEGSEVVGKADTADGHTHAFHVLFGQMIDLGTLGGGNSAAYAVSNDGTVVGQAERSDGNTHAFTCVNCFPPNRPAMTDLGTLDGDNSAALALSNTQYVGLSSYNNPLGGQHAFSYVYSGTTGMNDLGTLCSIDFTCDSIAWGINQREMIVGQASISVFQDIDNSVHAFLHTPGGGNQDLGTLGGSNSYARAINDAGQITGFSATHDGPVHAFFRTVEGQMFDIGTLGGRASFAYAINDEGEVVGSAKTILEEDHAFLWRGGVMTDLNTYLPRDSGWVLIEAHGINDQDPPDHPFPGNNGNIAGWGTHDGHTRAFLMELSYDGDPPVSSAGNPPPGPRPLLLVTVTSHDTGSGTRSITYSATGAQPIPLTTVDTDTVTLTFNVEGTTTLTYYATDNAGNTEAPQTLTIQIDRTPPVTSAAVGAPSAPPGAAQPFVTRATPITLAATDAFGVASLSWRAYPVGQTPPAFASAPGATATLTLDGADGPYQVDYFATDTAGNAESPKTLQLTLDDTAPLITVAAPTATTYTHDATLTLDYAASDGAGAGVASVVALVDGSPTLAGHGLASGQAIPLSSELALGTHTFSVAATDALGNAATQTVTFSIVVTAEGLERELDALVAAGEIRTPGIATSLAAKLSAAAAQRARGNCGAAAGIYAAFIAELDAQTGSGVSSSAATLLGTDAAWLAAHCP